MNHIPQPTQPLDLAKKKVTNQFRYYYIIMYYKPISKNSGKSLVCSDVFEQSLLEKLKASRPKSPPLLQKLSNNESFCSYWGSLMFDLPTTTKRRLQDEFISTVISELNY